jgi:hypothetical protein
VHMLTKRARAPGLAGRNGNCLMNMERQVRSGSQVAARQKQR